MDFAGLLGPAVDGWRIGLHPLNGLPQLSLLFLRLVPDPCSSIRCTVWWAAAIFRIIIAPGVFVVQRDGRHGGRRGGRRGRPGIGVAAFGGHHRPGLATLKVGELTEMAVSGAGTSARGA